MEIICKIYLSNYLSNISPKPHTMGHDLLEGASIILFTRLDIAVHTF